MRRFPRGLPTLLLLSALGLRAWTFLSVDGVLPLSHLYVDEITYAAGPVSGAGFERPPGMYLLAAVAGWTGTPIPGRAVISLLSMVPAAAVALAFAGRMREAASRRWALACAAMAALSPVGALFGLFLLPAVPAAALVSAALLLRLRGRVLAAGFAAGCAALFRGELLLLPVVHFLVTAALRRGLRHWTVYASGTALAIAPVILVNAASGSGPVIAENGAENLWLGTDWELLSTPPGVEFEQLVSVAPEAAGTVEAAFMRRALSSISAEPLPWLAMGLRKVAAWLALPGPGRNLEVSRLLSTTGLAWLLPLMLPALALGLPRALRGRGGGTDWRPLALSMVLTGAAAAFLLFPAARYALAVSPALWFLAASRPPSRRELLPAGAVAALVTVASLMPYPGAVRPGLTEVLEAERMISEGRYHDALDLLSEAGERGFDGADLHNLAGTAYALTGRVATGLSEFEEALRHAPGSPSLWKNYAVCLWNAGRPGDASEAAMTAVELDPALKPELGPLLVEGGEG